MTRKVTICLLFSLLFIYHATRAQNMSGTVAPACHFNNVMGGLSQLEQLQQHYVLLHFWNGDDAASITALQEYNALEAANMDKIRLLSVFFGTNKNQWQQLVALYHLDKERACILEKAFASRTAQDYHITSIPRTLLVDRSGIIVADNPSLLEIKQIISDDHTVAAYPYQIAAEEYLDNNWRTVTTTANDDVVVTEPTNESAKQYRVLLGDFGSLLYHNGFKHLQNLGTIEADMINQQHYRVWIGPTEDFQAALYALGQAQKAHYTKAKIVNFTNGQPETGVTPISNTMIVPDYAALYYKTTPVVAPDFENKNFAFTPASATTKQITHNSDEIVFQPPIVTQKPATREEYDNFVYTNGQTLNAANSSATLPSCNGSAIIAPICNNNAKQMATTTKPPAFTPPIVAEKPTTIDEYVKYVETNGQTSSTTTNTTLPEQKYNNSNSTSATQNSPIYENPATNMTQSSRVTPSQTTPTEKLTDPTKVTPASTTFAQDGGKKVSHVVRVSQSNQTAYKISEEVMQQRGELKSPIYDPYSGEEAVEYTSASQGNNPYGVLLSKQENKRVKQLDKKRDKHKTIAQKADKKARQIEQKAQDRSVFGKRKK